jgi:hypothetical protein
VACTLNCRIVPTIREERFSIRISRGIVPNPEVLAQSRLGQAVARARSLLFSQSPAVLQSIWELLGSAFNVLGFTVYYVPFRWHRFRLHPLPLPSSPEDIFEQCCNLLGQESIICISGLDENIFTVRTVKCRRIDQVNQSIPWTPVPNGNCQNVCVTPVSHERRGLSSGLKASCRRGTRSKHSYVLEGHAS